MMSAKEKTVEAADDQRQKPDDQASSGAGQTRSGMSKSMHDGVEVWCDCCSCEAEPYWIEAMQEASDSYP